MECPFVENQSVICVNDNWVNPLRPLPAANPQKWGRYTVRSFHLYDGHVYLTLAEFAENSGYYWAFFSPAVDPLAELLATRTRQKPRQTTKEDV